MALNMYISRRKRYATKILIDQSFYLNILYHCIYIFTPSLHKPVIPTPKLARYTYMYTYIYIFFKHHWLISFFLFFFCCSVIFQFNKKVKRQVSKLNLLYSKLLWNSCKIFLPVILTHCFYYNKKLKSFI